MSKKKCPEFENHERWLVSYADMVTLLFAVFVVLYALNLSDDQQPPTEEVAGSMQESFATPLEDIPLSRRIGPTEAGYGVFEHFRGNQIRPPLSKKFMSEDARVAVIEDEMSKVRLELEERLYGPNKFVSGDSKGEQRIVDVVKTSRGFKLQLLARHFYDPGSTKVRKGAQKDLDKIIEIIKEMGRDVTVQGHTDSIPPAGRMTNWELSALRATNVLEYMITKHNFPSTKLSAAGYADIRPIAHNGTKQGRSLNRRIEMHLDYDPEVHIAPGN